MSDTFEDGFGIDSQVLREVIQAQTQISKLGYDLGAVMDLVAGYVQRLTNAEGAVVELAEGDEMVYRAAQGIARPQLGLRLKRKESLSGLCIQEGRVLVCNDCDIDPRVDREACHKVGLRSMVVAPLIHDEIAVGVLKIVSSAPWAFTPKDSNILEMMSELIAAAMFHASKFEGNELYYLATHDALTNLANRSLFYERLRRYLAFARTRSSRLGLLILDMDHLKGMNDLFGHRAGDAAIRETASRIAGIFRESDTVARLGGDEFGVILPEIRSPDGVIAAAGRIIDEVELPYEFEDCPLSLGVSVGMAVFPDDATDLEALVDLADRSMYAAKRARKALKAS